MSQPLLAVDAVEAPLELVPIAVLGFLYGRRALTLARQGRPVPAWRLACFSGGLATIVATLIVLDHQTDVSLSWHVAEHLLIGDIAALLIVLGLTGPLLAPALRIRFFDRLRVLANPVVAFPLWALNFYLWHLPALYQGALEDSVLHAFEHLCIIVFGINMWMCLFGPLPMPRWFGNLGRLVYLLAVRIAGAILANVFLWSGTVFYSFYVGPDTARRISPLVDQNIAGGIMLAEGTIVTLILFSWLFMRTLREGEGRQDLLELARDHPLARGRGGAGRAVAGGGTDLPRLEPR